MEYLSGLDLGKLPASTVGVGVAFAIAAGTLYCFLGYRTLRFVLAFTGFILAGAVAGSLAAWWSDKQPAVTGILGLLGGVAGALAMLFLYKAGVFFLGTVGGAIIAQTACGGQMASWTPWAVLAGAAVGGLVALALERPVITIVTAAIGGWVLVAAFGYVVMGPEFFSTFRDPLEVGAPHWVALGCWGLLTLAGALAQFATHKPRTQEQAKG